LIWSTGLVTNRKRNDSSSISKEIHNRRSGRKHQRENERLDVLLDTRVSSCEMGRVGIETKGLPLAGVVSVEVVLEVLEREVGVRVVEPRIHEVNSVGSAVVEQGVHR
jgi:hypothetical protein